MSEASVIEQVDWVTPIDELPHSSLTLGYDEDEVVAVATGLERSSVLTGMEAYSAALIIMSDEVSDGVMSEYLRMKANLLSPSKVLRPRVSVLDGGLGKFMVGKSLHPTP